MILIRRKNEGGSKEKGSKENESRGKGRERGVEVGKGTVEIGEIEIGTEIEGDEGREAEVEKGLEVENIEDDNFTIIISFRYLNLF